MVMAYDPTGVAGGNLVTSELHTLGSSAAVVTAAGPFFRNGLIVTGTLAADGSSVTLVYGTDFIFSPLFLSKSLQVGQEIYSYVLILKPTIWTDVSVTYQAIGGDVDVVLLDEMANATYDPLVVTDYDQFLGQAYTLAPNNTVVPTSQLNWLEAYSGGIDSLVVQLRNRSTNRIEDLILSNAANSRAQDVYLAKTLSSVDVQDSKVSELLTAKDNLSAGITSSTTVNTQQDADIATATTNLADLNARVDIATTDIQTNTSSLTTIDGTITTHSNTLATLTADSSTTTTAVTDFTTQANTDLAIIQAAITANTTDVNTATVKELTQNNLIQTLDTLIAAQLTSINSNKGTTDTHDASVVALEASVAARDIIVNANKLNNDQQDIDIATNTANIATIQAGGIPSLIDTGGLATNILNNTNAIAIQATDIQTNTDKNTAQDLLLTGLNTDISNLETNGATDLTAIWIDQNNNTSAIALLEPLAATNTANNAAQDILLDANDAALLTAQGLTVDLTPVQNAIDANDALLLPMPDSITANTAIDDEQDTTITNFQSRVTTLTTGGTTDTTAVDAAVLAADNDINPKTTQVATETATNVTQDTAITALETDYTAANANTAALDAINQIVLANDDLLLALTTDVGRDTATQTAQRAKITEINTFITTYVATGVPTTTALEALIATNATDIATLTTTISGGTTVNGQQDAALAIITTDKNTVISSVAAMNTKLTELATSQVPVITTPANNSGLDTTIPITVITLGLTSKVKDVLLSVSWEIASDSNFTTILDSSIDDTVNLFAWTSTYTPVSGTDVYIRIRLKGETYGYTQYSLVTKASGGVKEIVVIPPPASGGGMPAGAVSISHDGSRLIIIEPGLPPLGVSTIHLYKWTGTAWSEILTSTLSLADVVPAAELASVSVHRFDWSVFLNQDGTKAVFSTTYTDTSQSLTRYYGIVASANTTSLSYDPAFALKSDPALIGTGTGHSVSADPSLAWIIVGSPNHNGGVGSARAYTQNADGSFTHLVYFPTPSITGAGYLFGYSSAYTNGRDGLNMLLIGSPGAVVNGVKCGAVIVYHYDMSGTASPNGSYPLVEKGIITPPDGMPGDMFGASIAASDFGEVVFIGAPGSSKYASKGGCVYRVVGTGSYTGKFTYTIGNNTTANAGFGTSLTVDGTGGNGAVSDGDINGRTLTT